MILFGISVFCILSTQYCDCFFIYLSQLKDMENLKDFGECIITIQACVIKKFLQGFMAPKQKKKRKHGGVESSKAEEVDDEKKLAAEARVRATMAVFIL